MISNHWTTSNFFIFKKSCGLSTSLDKFLFLSCWELNIFALVEVLCLFPWRSRCVLLPESHFSNAVRFINSPALQRNDLLSPSRGVLSDLWEALTFRSLYLNLWINNCFTIWRTQQVSLWKASHHFCLRRLRFFPASCFPPEVLTSPFLWKAHGLIYHWEYSLSLPWWNCYSLYRYVSSWSRAVLCLPLSVRKVPFLINYTHKRIII